MLPPHNHKEEIINFCRCRALVEVGVPNTLVAEIPM